LRSSTGALFCVVATTGPAFRGFGPYAPAVDARGRVYFTAERLPVAGLAVGDGLTAPTPLGTPPTAVDSHPATDGGGAAYFFAGGALWRTADGGPLRLTGSELAVGPLGPTANDSGHVAFRAALRGRPGVWLWRDGALERVAQADDDTLELRGLPVVDRLGRVAYRARCGDGRERLMRWTRGRVETLYATGDGVRDLKAFAAGNADGLVGIGATLADGSACATVLGGDRAPAERHRGELADVRAVLVDSAGALVIAGAATDRLALFASDGNSLSLLLEVGGDIGGRVVEEFALNAVSMSEGGYLAMRLRVSDGSEAIVRWLRP